MEMHAKLRLVVHRPYTIPGLIWTLIVFFPITKEYFSQLLTSTPAILHYSYQHMLGVWFFGISIVLSSSLLLYFFKKPPRILVFLGLNILAAFILAIGFDLLRKRKLVEVHLPGDGVGFFQTNTGLFGEFLIRNSYDVFFIYLFLTGMVYAVYNFNLTREKEKREAELEKQLLAARLNNLNSQLRPHFLFNTLNTISALIDIDANKAQQTLEDLGQLLRFSLEERANHFVSLSTEMDFVEKYLNIEQRRFGPKLKVAYQTNHSTHSATVPYLLLQPLIENAVRHGIAPHKAGGSIKINSFIKHQNLIIEIFNTAKELPVTPLKNGLGLANVRQRLENLYPDQHYFTIKKQQGGLLVHIEFPFIPFAGELWSVPQQSSIS